MSFLFSAICKASLDSIFAFLFLGDGLDHCLLYNVTNLRPQFFRHSVYQIWSLESICHFHCIIIRDFISIFWYMCRWGSHLWVGVPPMTYSWLVSGLMSWWAVDRVLPPSLAHSGSTKSGAWTDIHRRWVRWAISFSFSVFSVLPPFTSPLVLLPTRPSFSPWRLLVAHLFHEPHTFLFCDPAGRRASWERSWTRQSPPEATSQ